MIAPSCGAASDSSRSAASFSTSPFRGRIHSRAISTQLEMFSARNRQPQNSARLQNFPR
jgi:hypothetical protein